MTATFRFLECRLNPVILQLALHLDQIFERRLVVGVDRHPFRALRGWVIAVDPGRDLARHVPPYGFEGQFYWLASLPRFRPVVMVATALRVRPHRLNGVSPPVHEQHADRP